MRQSTARRRLGDSSGNQTGEFFFYLAGFGILVAFGLGSSEKFRTSKEVRSSQCLENLLRVERGTEVHELSCPVVNLPYREEERTSGTVIVCPDPEKHLRLDSYLARRSEGWDFQTSLASASGNSPDSIDTIELDNIPASLQVESSGVILELGPGFLFRYLALPFGLLFSVLCLLVGLSLMVDALRDPDHSIKEALIECAAIFVFVVGLMSTVSAAIAIDLGIGESLGVKYPWDFVGTVFHIQQDRFYAQVKSSLAPRMDKILSTMRERPNAIFAAHGAGTHNIPAPEGFEKYPVTFKSDLADKVANLQLSFASKTSNRGTVWVLDADIDERTGFAHAAEAIRNIVTGGKTNPYTVHELLASEGYRVPYEIPA